VQAGSRESDHCGKRGINEICESDCDDYYNRDDDDDDNHNDNK
jgi:hypothetical protein